MIAGAALGAAPIGGWPPRAPSYDSLYRLTRGGNIVYTLALGIRSNAADTVLVRGIGATPIGGAPLATGAVEVLVPAATRYQYFADRVYITGPTDAPANTYFAPRARELLALERTVSLAPDTAGDGSASGRIELDNIDGFFDSLLAANNVNGTPAEIRYGDPATPYQNLPVLWSGLARRWVADDDTLRIEVTDSRASLDRPLATAIYTGAGGGEGDSALAGQVKPVAYGLVRNVSPPLISEAAEIYQLHVGPIQQVIAVRDRGYAGRVFAADYADYDTLAAASLTSGQYATCLDAGLLRVPGLGSNSVVTVDYRGAASAGYAGTAAAVIASIVADFGVLADWDSLRQLELRVPGEIGVVVAPDESAASVIDRISRGVGAQWWQARDGRLRWRVLDDPRTDASSLHLTDADIIEIGEIDPPESVSPPNWRRRVHYQRNWTPQTGQDLAGGVTQVDRQWLSAEWRTATESLNSVRAANLLATAPPPLESVLDSASDAEALALRLLQLHGRPRQFLRVVVGAVGHLIEPGASVRVTYRGLGLNAGKFFRAWPTSESAADRTVEVTLWG